MKYSNPFGPLLFSFFYFDKIKLLLLSKSVDTINCTTVLHHLTLFLCFRATLQSEIIETTVSGVPDHSGMSDVNTSVFSTVSIENTGILVNYINFMEFFL